jgi:hypothetical protein
VQSGTVSNAINPFIWAASDDGSRNSITKMMRRKRKKHQPRMKEETILMTKRISMVMERRLRPGKSLGNWSLFIVGLAPIATLAMLKTSFLSTNVSVEGLMNLITHLWSYRILVESIVRARSMSTALMIDAMSCVTPEAALLATLMYLSIATVERNRKGSPVQSPTEASSLVKANARNS